MKAILLLLSVSHALTFVHGTLTHTAIIGIVKLMFVLNAPREQFLWKKDALQLMIFAKTGICSANAQTAIKDISCKMEKMENALSIILLLQLAVMEMMMAADAMKMNACNAMAASTLWMGNAFQLMKDAELGT